MDFTLQPGESFPDNVVFQQDPHLPTSHSNAQIYSNTRSSMADTYPGQKKQAL